MRVIPVAGLSGSGKTTFIRSLVPLLARLGPVGTVKHTGHHSMELPEGKDTTVMFGAGAAAVAGVDREKTLVTLGSSSLAGALDLLADRGMAFAVVEGFKDSPLPKIVTGDADLEGCILRNPSPGDVIPALDRFPNYFSLGGILRELGGEAGGDRIPPALSCAALPLPGGMDGEALDRLEQELPGLVEGCGDQPGVIGIRAVLQRGALFGKADGLLFGAAARSGEAATATLARMISESRRMLGQQGTRPRP